MKYLLMILDVAVAILSIITIVLWFADRKNNQLDENKKGKIAVEE